MEVDKLAMLSADVASGKISSRTLNNYVYLRVLNSNYLPQKGDLVRSAAMLPREQTSIINAKRRL